VHARTTSTGLPTSGPAVEAVVGGAEGQIVGGTEVWFAAGKKHGLDVEKALVRITADPTAPKMRLSWSVPDPRNYIAVSCEGFLELRGNLREVVFLRTRRGTAVQHLYDLGEVRDAHASAGSVGYIRHPDRPSAWPIVIVSCLADRLRVDTTTVEIGAGKTATVVEQREPRRAIVL
jgi:hypothetical protein